MTEQVHLRQRGNLALPHGNDQSERNLALRGISSISNRQVWSNSHRGGPLPILGAILPELKHLFTPIWKN